jgi:hypothetical protein
MSTASNSSKIKHSNLAFLFSAITSIFKDTLEL